jgi:hypothetical protein
MSTHIFSYNFLTRIKYIFYTVATVAYEGVRALDIPSDRDYWAMGQDVTTTQANTSKIMSME